MKGTDKVLAEYFKVINNVGYALIGRAISEVFGVISKNYYFDSIKVDIENAKEDIKNIKQSGAYF